MFYFLRFSINSQADASEFLGNLVKMFKLIAQIDQSMSVTYIPMLRTEELILYYLWVKTAIKGIFLEDSFEILEIIAF